MSTTTTTTAAASATASCLNIKPGKDGFLPPEACDALLPYVPSFAAAVLFTVIFGATLVAHLVQAITFRKRFCWVVIMGAFWEVTAMVFRVLLTRNQSQVAFYLPNFLFIQLAPLWLNAFMYMILGRMVYFLVPEKRLFGISAKRLATIFVCLDVLTFLVQATGGILASQQNGSQSIIQTGMHIYMVGIGVQEFCILVFTALLVAFQRRVMRSALPPQVQGPSWKWLFFSMYTALILITIRIIYRLVEYSDGTDYSTSPILSHEWYMYVFDATPISLAFLVVNIFHPGRFLIGPDSEFPRLTRMEKKRLKAERKARKARKGRDDEFGAFYEDTHEILNSEQREDAV
ncbi:hypothetical protein ASPZODRAFT_1237105 [Penicilliopsis zonata CBS 506.65]|uniref:RTA1 domain protein n=1 Tax=Penicilliopsis zonata CBS 506.65 TaxID=1073090 RepID=A0A1L9S6W7_9EURO|nr:hypothetical protein ASPZODRAFT_1237105 [Penicilliopsis zonata CBS 506.65]OJJ42907.1 hypothetical protein ASPZODRAFT_1237105 [Penicilliopsis zonata CBS 506.65]